MKNEILAHLNNPQYLERLYRSDKSNFKRTFNSLYPEIQEQELAHFWNARLNHEREEISWGTKKEWGVIIAACLLAGFFAKIPHLFQISEAFFYPRNIGFIFLPILTAYFAWKNNLRPGLVIFITSFTLVSLFYINFFPGTDQSDILILVCIHLPLMLWILLGTSFVGNNWKDKFRRLDYLRYNGDLVVMTALILLAGGIMTGITIGLFSMIGLNIETFYFDNVVVMALPAAPVLATYLIRTNPQLVGKVSPVIAKIFSPLVLVMLVIYLIAMIYSGKDPYNDREFLLIFNVLLIGVMAIIFFSVAETSNNTSNPLQSWMLFLLSVVTIIVNAIALSAIVFRISEWGLTPNRLAVLGGNVLILINLLLVTYQLLRLVLKKVTSSAVGVMTASYLPLYFLWTLIVIFLFPLFFGYE